MSGVTLGTIAMATLATAAVVGTGYSIYSGEQQKSAQADALNQQKDAQAKAQASATAQAKTAEEATNRALSKSPDSSAILSAQQQSSKTGAGGTMLTGSQGVDPNSLQLDKKTLLGA